MSEETKPIRIKQFYTDHGLAHELRYRTNPDDPLTEYREYCWEYHTAWGWWTLAHALSRAMQGRTRYSPP